MIKILFVCHGNICRSPMAEFVMKDMVQKKGIADKFYIESAATSTEEIGNPVHHGTRNLLSKLGISTAGKYARQMTRSDYDEFDYIIGMDTYNIRNIIKIVGGDRDDKVSKLTAYAGLSRDIADPWYTGDFDATYSDVKNGCEGLLKKLGF